MSIGDTQNFQRYPPPRPSELPGIFGEVYNLGTDRYADLFTDFTYPANGTPNQRVSETVPPPPNPGRS
jgi:protein kinase A